MSVLATAPAHRLRATTEEQRWLVEELWLDQAVGIVGGEPKCCKSFLALDMAVAVASGTPCLRRFRVARPGRVLLLAAEDSLSVVRARLDGICAAAGVALAELDLHVVTESGVRLDRSDDRVRIANTVEELRPRLLVLDPFVRLHAVDENQSVQIAPLLASLRHLQRRFALAVLVVHHARKGAAHIRAGQALRGSSEFHAWGDSNLYLRRFGDRLTLGAEHRAAAAIEPISLALRSDPPRLALEIVDSTPPPPATAPLSPADRALQALAQAQRPLPLRALRRVCRMRTAQLCHTLAELARQGRVRRTDAGYELLSATASFPFPDPL